MQNDAEKHTGQILASEREAARMLGISWRHLLTLEQTGLCPPAVRLGRRKLYPIENLRTWAASGCKPQGGK